MRLFIALEFSRKTRQSLSASAEVLRQICDKASLTREENFHLTLVFLGEIPPDRVKDIRAAMDECVAPPVRVSITGPGRFRQREGDTVWRGAEPADNLRELYSRLCKALAERGFVTEDRTYTPHVTLARRARLKSGCTIEALAARMPPLSEEIRAVTLMHSHTAGGKLTYTPVYRTTLREK